MTSIRIETFIAAPPERVFDLARDLDFHQRSLAHTGERAVGGRTSGRIELGEEVEWSARHLGLRMRLRSRIASMDAPQRFVDVQVTGPFAHYEHVHEFLARDGGTLMVDAWRHRSPLGPLGWIADRLFVERHMRRLLTARAHSLKSAAEAPSTA